MEEISVDVKHVSKRFNLYHEKRNSIYESLIGYFSRNKHYEILQTLDDVTFDVKKGEMFGIIGSNGSGKTTLLRILSNIYSPDSGSVDIKGLIIPILALGLGFHPELTATTNIIQSGTLLGFSRTDISNRISDIIEFAELEKFADVKIKNFSSGMQMRLAFSTAMQVDPDILILDEVFAVGDLNFQKKCFNAIMDFKKRGKSIIFVSHEMSSVRNFCDRALFLHKGKIESIGKPDKVISSYISSLENKIPKKKKLDDDQTSSFVPTYWNYLVQVKEYLNMLATDDPKLTYWQDISNKFHSSMPFTNILVLGSSDFFILNSILESNMVKQIDVIDHDLENIKNSISQKGFMPINYFHHGYDSISKLNKKYDAILCGPILNYIEDIDSFFKSLQHLLYDHGLLFVHDYVGPSKMNFSSEHVKLLQQINSKLPKIFRTLSVFNKLPDPNLAHMVNHSKSIPEIFLKYFDLKFSRNLNGGIAYPILFGNIEKFKTLPNGINQLTNLLKIDQTYSEDNTVPILFWYAVGKSKK